MLLVFKREKKMYDTIKQDREAVEYLNAIIEKVTVKLEKLQEKHEVEGVMNQRSISKVLSILEYIIHDFRSRVSAQEAKEKFHEELNKFTQFELDEDGYEQQVKVEF